MLPLVRNPIGSNAQGTTFIGHKAFAHCKQLVEVDLLRTQVDVVHMQVFAHCQSLAYVTLPTQLKEISAEAFEACGSLCTLALPQTLRYIGHRAFAGCNKLVCLTYRGTRTNRRGLHIADNAYEACNALTIPGGICYLSLHSSNSNQGNRSRCRRNTLQVEMQSDSCPCSCPGPNFLIEKRQTSKTACGPLQDI